MTMSWAGVLAGRARGVGKTTVTAEAAKKIGATVVCMNTHDAARVAKEHEVPTVSVHSSDRLRGTRGPLLFDPDAVYVMAAHYEMEIARLDAERLELARQLGDAQNVAADLQARFDAVFQKRDYVDDTLEES